MINNQFKEQLIIAVLNSKLIQPRYITDDNGYKPDANTIANEVMKVVDAILRKVR